MSIDLNSSVGPVLPGQLGTPGMVLREDPRAHPAVVATLAAFEMDGALDPPPVGYDGPIEAKLEFAAAAEPGFEGLFAALFQDLPPIIGVQRSTEVIEGVDGNDITLHIHRPEGVDGLVPGVLHTHGGGMVMLSAAGPLYARWRDELAATGLVVVGVEFRNGAGVLGPSPFPAGLNDCKSGLEWMNENREALGIDALILSGESGGGNLALANALLAKREDRLDHFDGIYAQCPYISNAYALKDQPLPSLVENDGYFLRSDMMGTLSAIYTPDDPLSRDPLAWPYHATVDDVSGLPPTVISVNELDLLRDEGLAFFHTLVRAGVPAVSRTVNGTTHAGDVIFRAAIPEIYLTTIRDIHSFASSL